MDSAAPESLFEPEPSLESGTTKRRFRNLVDASGLLARLVSVDARPAADDVLARVHDRAYIEDMRARSAADGGDAGEWTPFGRGTFDVAALAAGGVIEAADAVLAGRVRNAYALVRPPGHHAMPELAMGFCIFGNAAIAGRHLLDVRKLDRIAFVDWDVHHGNGTQAIFWEDPRALTISVHQDNCFPPNSGHLTERGAGRGEGFNINIPLPPGSGVGAYEATIDRVVLPALKAFKPEMIIVPSGF